MRYARFDKSDLDQNNLWAALGCICFPVPLFMCKDSRLGKYCANHGLVALLLFVVLCIVGALINALLGWIPLIGWLLRLVFSLAKIATVLGAMWLGYQAFIKQPVRIPYVSDIEIFK